MPIYLTTTYHGTNFKITKHSDGFQITISDKLFSHVDFSNLIAELSEVLTITEPDTSVDYKEQVRLLLKVGRSKLQAIKLVKDTTGCDLRTAKETVENIERDMQLGKNCN